MEPRRLIMCIPDKGQVNLTKINDVEWVLAPANKCTFSSAISKRSTKLAYLTIDGQTMLSLSTLEESTSPVEIKLFGRELIEAVIRALLVFSPSLYADRIASCQLQSLCLEPKTESPVVLVAFYDPANTRR
jgi:hypothetical protein